MATDTARLDAYDDLIEELLIKLYKKGILSYGEYRNFFNQIE